LQVIAALWLQVGLLRVAGWGDFSLGQNLSSLEPERSDNLQQKRSANLQRTKSFQPATKA